MEKIKEALNFFQNINKEIIIDILIGLIIIILFSMLSSLFSYIIIKLFNRKEKDREKIKLNPFYLPVKALVSCSGIYIALYIMNLPKDLMEMARKLFDISLICIISKSILNLVSPDSTIFIKLKESQRFHGDDTLVNFISKIAKTIIYIITVFFIMSEFDYDLSGLITGLGLSGVIVALAAQDIAKNLFGGMAIILDKPFIVGDWIKTKTYEGTVEDITFRSTRIRTADNTVVTIQNSTMSNEAIVNFSRMDRKRYNFDLKLPLETPADKIECIVSKIRFVLKNHPDIIDETEQVYFTTVQENVINISVTMYTSLLDSRAFRRI